MTDNEESVRHDEGIITTGRLPILPQTSPENINVNHNKDGHVEHLITGDLATLKKITFPISPFKKKLKPRTMPYKPYNDLLDVTKDQNGLKTVSINENMMTNVGELNRIDLIRKLDRDISNDKTIYKPVTDLYRDRISMPMVNNLTSSKTLADENHALEEPNIDRYRYMHLLNLNKKTLASENCGTSNLNKSNTVANRMRNDYSNSLEEHKITPVGMNYEYSDNPGDGRTMRTDLLNLTLMDKKKKLVDRIKKSITKNGTESVAKENIDLSIVKEELPDSEMSDSNEVEVNEKTSQLAPLEEVNIKTEPANNLLFEDTIPNSISNVDHFMALPVLLQNGNQKMMTDKKMLPDNDCIVVHKLVCLICKKSEMISAKENCIQGNIFLCKTCTKLFDRVGEMNKPLFSADKCNILDVTCIRCNLTFSNALEVDTHNKEVHKDDFSGAGATKRHIKPQYCGECNRTFSESDDACNHIRSRRHKCDYCNKLFSTNSDLKKHVNIHTNEKTYICIYCSKAFNSRGNMVKHLETHKERKRSFKCEFCNKTFLKSDHLKVHVNTHTNEKLYECPYCKKTFNRKYCLQLHVNIHTLEKIYECHFCNKICMDPSTLRKHVATHSDTRPFKCEYCEKTFKQKPHLSAHMKMHDIKQTFPCTYCDKFFFSKNTLRVHINTHTHEKTFLCVYCQKTFTSKSNLLTHINNKHTVDRTYNCSYCDKVFTDPSTVRKHENIHTNALTYQCAYCEKVFLRKTHLRSHINMHIKYKPYKCKLCDKSFAIKGYLKVHINIHKGVKPFKCKLCGKAFTSKSNLILHTNSHTKERLFRCSYCHKDFTQKANLKSHIIRSHMETTMPPI